MKKLIFEKMIVKTATCWIWQGVRSHRGYGRWGSGYAHRKAYVLFKSKIPKGLFVLHKCDNPPCVNPNHLFLGTIKDNNRDMDRKGRRRSKWSSGKGKGELNPNAKLTIEQIREIRKIQGKSQAEIAKAYNVSQTLVSKIRLGQVWPEDY